MKIKNTKNEHTSVRNFLSSVFAIVLGLLFGFIILLVSNPPQAMGGFGTILVGGLGDGLQGISRTIHLATPLIMTGLSVGFAFKVGLFNIGASGQFTMGAYVAVLIAVRATAIPVNIRWIVSLLGAMLAGALWGSIPGFLKAFRNVNEVISSIMLNYIGMYLVNILIVKTIYDKYKNQSLEVPKAANLPKLAVNKLSPSLNLNLGIIIAIICVVIIYILINKTTFGYELKAVGSNKFAGRYAGINEKKSIIVSMTVSGALAGIGGALLYLSGTGKFLQVIDILATEGFNGISVALLGLSNPIGIFFAAIFIAHITVGGGNLQLYNFTPEVIDIIIAAIIYCGAFSLLFKHFISSYLKKKHSKEEVK